MQFGRSTNPAHTGIRQWDNRAERVEDYTRLYSIGSNDCWCGQPQNHDWEGKDNGKPHPR